MQYFSEIITLDTIKVYIERESQVNSSMGPTRIVIFDRSSLGKHITQ